MNKSFEIPHNSVPGDAGLVEKRFVIPMSMCGRANLSPAKLMSHVGDWTWDLVRDCCGANPYDAWTESGDESYLAYIYIRIYANPNKPLNSFRFGTELDVASRIYAMGSEAVGAIHHLRPHGSGTHPLAPTYETMYGNPDPDSLYIETFNKWISRSSSGNEALVKSSPKGFVTDHLPHIPDIHLPPRRYRPALSAQSFAAPDDTYEPIVSDFDSEYGLDRDRDINGVGLVYYATYFDFAERATTGACIAAGIENASTIRSISDQQIVYLANCDFNKSVRFKVDIVRLQGAPGEFISNVKMVRASDQTLLAICTTQFRLSQAAYMPEHDNELPVQPKETYASAAGENKPENGNRMNVRSPLPPDRYGKRDWKARTTLLVNTLRDMLDIDSMDCETKLLSSELIDSFGVLEYIAMAETIFEVNIPDSLRRVEVLDSVEVLVATLRSEPNLSRRFGGVVQASENVPAAAAAQPEPPSGDIPMSLGDRQKAGRSTGFWSRFYKLLFRIKGIQYGPGLNVLGPIYLRLDGHACNIRLGSNVTLRPHVELKVRENGSIICHDGVLIDNNARLVAANDARIELGENVRIGVGTIVNAGDDVLVGCGSIVSGYCYLSVSDHQFALGQPIAKQPYVHAPARVGEDVMIGAYAFIGRGANIGRGAVISARSQVSGDIPENAIVSGQPAAVIKFRR